MNPRELAATLRQMATAVDNSKRPSIARVRHDLELLISRVAEEQQQSQQQQGQQQGQQEQQSQQQQQALPQSGVGKGMIEKLLKDLAGAHEKGDHNGFKEILEKLERAAG